ncbi:MAG: M50 family metallopeptidase [Chloroflexi bacterium]|nr:M50 family metallopeptidase [Chloroflexota bacterium]MCC6896114.1 M50 family metallopeptidase [Anaerolineae bacterium]
MFAQFNRSDRRLLLAILAVIVVLILWNIPQLDFILYPFRLFVTYVHESGHGTAALISGGRFLGFEIFSNGSGQAITAGGSRWLILPAGYLGAALFGSILFYLNNRFHRSRVLAVAIGIGLIVYSVLFGRIALLSLIVGSAFGIGLVALGWKANEYLNSFFLNILALLTGLNAVLDVYYLVGDSSASLGSVQNDAAAFSRDVFALPAAFWALLWSLIAIGMLGVAIWYGVIRPMRRGTTS